MSVWHSARPFQPIAVRECDVACPIADIADLGGHAEVLVLVRLHEASVGYLRLPLTGGVCAREDIARAIVQRLLPSLLRRAAEEALAASTLSEPTVSALLQGVPLVALQATPSVTAAICTNRAADEISDSLEALSRLEYPGELDLLVVSNGTNGEAVERMVRNRFPAVRHVHEPRPGLDWARNRAVLESQSDILAFTDDDALADAHWVDAIVRAFEQGDDIGAVTGLVAPASLEHEAQFAFEQYGGFGRGFDRFRCAPEPGARTIGNRFGNPGILGTGANMAFRHRLFDRIGGFSPWLDAGTPTAGGGDLDMLYRTLKAGYVVAYEPRALVWHRHRADWPELERQIHSWGTAMVGYVLSSIASDPREALAFGQLVARRMVHRWITPQTRRDFPSALIKHEVAGVLVGARRYLRARRESDRIFRRFPDRSGHERITPTRINAIRADGPAPRGANGFHTPREQVVVDLGEHCVVQRGVSAGTEVFDVVVRHDGHLLGQRTRRTGGRDVPASVLRDLVAEVVSAHVAVTVSHEDRDAICTRLLRDGVCPRGRFAVV